MSLPDKTQMEMLARELFPNEIEEGPSHILFLLALTATDAYVRELERIASDDPAPFLAGTTPTEAALRGLEENLAMIREKG